MKNIKIIVSIFILIISASTKAQTSDENTFIGAGYTYFNRSFGEISLRFLTKNDGGFLLGANVLLGSRDNKFLAIPEINATQYFWKNSSVERMPFVRLNVSPKTITPQIGIGALFFEISAGYGFSISESPYYKTNGFRIGFNINIPLEFKMKIM